MTLLWSSSFEASGMNKEMECMCLKCGISLYLPVEKVFLDEEGDTDARLIRGAFCTECGGPLILIGKAGAEPHYRVE